MLRLALSLYLTLATTMGPCACCCVLGQLSTPHGRATGIKSHKFHGGCCGHHGSHPERSRTEKGTTDASTGQPRDRCPCPEKQPFVATVTAANFPTSVHQANLFLGADCLAAGGEGCIITHSRAGILLKLPVNRHWLGFLPILRC